MSTFSRWFKKGSVVNDNQNITIIGNQNCQITIDTTGLSSPIIRRLDELVKQWQAELEVRIQSERHLNSLITILQQQVDEWIERYKNLESEIIALKQTQPDYVSVLTQTEVFLNQGKFSEVTALLEPLKTKEDERTKQNAKVHFILGQAYQLDNKLLQALPELELAYHHDHQNIEYGIKYALLLHKQNQYKKSQFINEELIIFFNRLPRVQQEEQRFLLLAIRGHLAMIYTETQQHDKAEKLHKKNLLIYRELIKTNDSVSNCHNCAVTLNNFANLVQVDLNRRVEAEQYYQEALIIYQKLAETNPNVFLPYVAITLGNLTNIIKVDPTRCIEAEKNYQQVLIIYRNLDSTKINPTVFAPSIATTLNNLANLLSCYSNRCAEAEIAYREALYLYRKLAKINSIVFLSFVAMSINNIADLIRNDSDRHNEAIQCYRESLTIYRSLAKTDPTIFRPNITVSLKGLIFLYSQAASESMALILAGLVSELVEIQRQLFEIEPSIYGDDLARSLGIMGFVQLAQGQEAYMTWKEALQVAKEQDLRNEIETLIQNRYLKTF